MKEVKRLDVVIRLEYIRYDAITGEHLERPKMAHLVMYIS